MKYIDIVDIRQAVKAGEIWFIKHRECTGEERLYVENGAGERVLIEIKANTEDVV